MPYANLFRPLSPMHRRTNRDSPSSFEATLRVDATNFLRERPVQPGLQKPHTPSPYRLASVYDTIAEQPNGDLELLTAVSQLFTV